MSYWRALKQAFKKALKAKEPSQDTEDSSREGGARRCVLASARGRRRHGVRVRGMKVHRRVGKDGRRSSRTGCTTAGRDGNGDGQTRGQAAANA